MGRPFAKEVLAEGHLAGLGFTPVHLDTLDAPRTSTWLHVDGRRAVAVGAPDGTATVTIRGPGRNPADADAMARAGAAAFDLVLLRERDPSRLRDRLAAALVAVHEAMTGLDPETEPAKATTSRWVDDVGLEALAWPLEGAPLMIVPKVMDEVGAVYAVSDDVEETFPGWTVFEIPADAAVLADALAGRLAREDAIGRGLITRFLPSQVDARWEGPVETTTEPRRAPPPIATPPIAPTPPSGPEDSRLARIGSLAASREAAILAILRGSGEVDMIALNRTARTAGIGYGRISDAETVRAIVGELIDLGLVSRHRKAGTGQTRFWYSLTAKGAVKAAQPSKP